MDIVVPTAKPRANKSALESSCCSVSACLGLIPVTPEVSLGLSLTVLFFIQNWPGMRAQVDNDWCWSSLGRAWQPGLAEVVECMPCALA
uniref:Uncharacterized protein n=1 Tax=Mus musculus TaxID=10090 RepID=Q3U2H1_MOUSE|nr:unnamed protein product [Mus musculus]